MGAALRHRVAGNDHRPLRLGDQSRRTLERRTVATKPRSDACCRAELDRRLGIEHVGGKRQEDGSRRRCQRRLGGAMNSARQIFEAAHLRRPFDEGPGDGREIGP
jgi:hypothetical protein